MGACDSIVVDLTPSNVTVTMSTDPCYDVSIVQAGVTMEAITLAGQGPPGAQGDKGDQGDPGAQGDPGPPGTQGLPGAAATIAVGATVTGAPGSAATVSNSGSSSAATFDFSIPAGVQGNTGNTGPTGNAATVAVGTTTTGAAGSNAAVTNSGTSSAAVFNFTVPQGVQGVQGIQGPQGPSGSGTGDMLKSVYDTNNDSIVDHAALADTAPWTGITGKPASFTPSAHETTHLDNGSDAIPLATTARTGLSPQIPSTNPTKQFHRGDNTYAAANYPDLTNLPASFVPSAHAPTHVTGGADIIPVATSSATGLVPILPADVTKYLRGDGTFARAAVSTDAGNIATLGSDNLISVPQSTIWNIRLRNTVNVLGNASFEVDQRNVGGVVTSPAGATFMLDRWTYSKAASVTATVTTQQATPAAGSEILVPSTNFNITRNFLTLKLTAQQASMAAGDYVGISQSLEGPQIREIFKDASSFSILCRSSVANLTFCLTLRDPPTTGHSFTKLLTIPTANVWTLLSVPNIPVFPSGNFTTASGVQGCYCGITLACGSTFTGTTDGSWQAGNYLTSPGIGNWCGQAVNSTFDCAFCQWEAGPVCSTLQDLPTVTNSNQCLRYFTKSFDPATALGTATTNGMLSLFQSSTTTASGPCRFPNPMAKVPTMTAYNHATGAANSCRIAGSATDYAVSAFGIGNGGFYNITTATMPAVVAGAQIFMHYTADTGW